MGIFRYFLPHTPPVNFDEVASNFQAILDNLEKAIEGATDHSQLTGVTSDQHHAQSHTLVSHSTKDHSELTGVTANQHHAQLHQAAHQQGGGDANAGTHAINITGNADTVDNHHIASSVGHYLKVGSILIQYGIFETVSYSAAGWYTSTITLPTSFNNVLYTVVCSCQPGTGGYILGHIKVKYTVNSTTQFDVQYEIETAPNPAGTAKFNWIAIGD